MALTTILAFLTGVRVRVRGQSMYPVLVPGEGVLFDRLVYARCDPAVGDVVLARDPRDGRYLIKRVSEVLGAQRYMLMGDDPEHSTDSRHFGPVPRSSIVGRAWLVYWPPNHVRHLL